MGSRGWNGGGSSPRSSGSCQEVALGNQGSPQSREHLGTPKPKSSVHQWGQEQRHSLLHAQFPRARTIPVPALECSQGIWGFLSWHSREAPPPASTKASSKAKPGRLGVAVTLCPHRDTLLAVQPLHSPCHPFPPADLGEPLTSPGWEPGSKLQAWPHPCSPKRA